MTSVLVQLAPIELTLCITTVELVLGALDVDIARILVIAFRSVPETPVIRTPRNPLLSIRVVEFEKPVPPIALQGIVTIILLNILLLDRTAIPMQGRTAILRPATFIQEMIKAPVSSRAGKRMVHLTVKPSQDLLP